MRIDNWPMDRIMRLPDWCFGRRWWVGVYCGEVGGGVAYFMAEENLPDKFVVWSVLINSRQPLVSEALRVTMRLGDHIPLSAAEAITMERVMKGVSTPTIVYELFCAPNCNTYIQDLRHLIESAGRKLCVVSNGDQVHPYQVTVGMMITSVPREVPDWMCRKEAEIP